MRKYTYDWFVKDLEEGCNIDFRYDNHIYSVENKWFKGKREYLFLTRDGDQLTDQYTDAGEFLNKVLINGKSFKELFHEEEKKMNDFRMISKFC